MTLTSSVAKGAYTFGPNLFQPNACTSTPKRQQLMTDGLFWLAGNWYLASFELQSWLQLVMVRLALSLASKLTTEL